MEQDEIAFMKAQKPQHSNLVIAMPYSGADMFASMLRSVETHTCRDHPMEFYQGIRMVADNGQRDGKFGKENAGSPNFRAISEGGDLLLMNYNLRSLFFHTHSRNRAHVTEAFAWDDPWELELFVDLVRKWNEQSVGAEGIIKITWLIRDVGEIYERSGLSRDSLEKVLERFKAASELEDQWINYNDLIDHEKAQKIILWTGPRLWPNPSNLKVIINNHRL